MEYQPILSRFPNTGIKVRHTSEIDNPYVKLPLDWEGGYVATLTFLAEEGKSQPVLKVVTKPSQTEQEAIQSLLEVVNSDYITIAWLYTKKLEVEETILAVDFTDTELMPYDCVVDKVGRVVKFNTASKELINYLEIPYRERFVIPATIVPDLRYDLYGCMVSKLDKVENGSTHVELTYTGYAAKNL